MRDTNKITEVPKEQEDKPEAPTEDSEIETIVKKQKTFDPETIISYLGSMKKK